MSIARPSTLQAPLVLLTLISLGILSVRLWPWRDVVKLPHNGAPALGLIGSLLAYIILFWWIGREERVSARKALSSGVAWGFVGGVIFIAQVLRFNVPHLRIFPHPDAITIGLIAVPAILWGSIAYRTRRSQHSIAFSAVTAAWSAMVSCVMACTAVLAKAYFSMGTFDPLDLWKYDDTLKLGFPVTKALADSLSIATGFLLIGPGAGLILGVLFAAVARTKKA